MSYDLSYITIVYFLRSSSYEPSCQLQELFAASVRVQVKSSVMPAKERVEELSFVKYVMVHLVEFANGPVRRRFNVTNAKTE